MIVLKVYQKILHIVQLSFCNWVFDNFKLAEELFAKALQSFETCVLVTLIIRITNNIWWNFQRYFSTIFYSIFYISNLWILNFKFKVLHYVILYWYYIKTKLNYNTLTVPFEKSKMISFGSSIMKNINISTKIKLSASASSACCLIKSIAIILCLLK